MRSSTMVVWEEGVGFHGGLVVAVATMMMLVATMTMVTTRETTVMEASIYVGGNRSGDDVGYGGGGNGGL
jgi:prolipoprotein diacylglyceryltransferase